MFQSKLLISLLICAVLVQNLANSQLLAQIGKIADGIRQGVLGEPFNLVFRAVGNICKCASLYYEQSGPKKHLNKILQLRFAGEFAVDNKLLPDSLNPSLSRINFQLLTSCDEVNIPVSQAEDLVKQPGFNVSQQTVIYAQGFFEPISVPTLAKAYRCRGDTNFVVSHGLNYFSRVAYLMQILLLECRCALFRLQHHQQSRSGQICGRRSSQTY